MLFKLVAADGAEWKYRHIILVLAIVLLMLLISSAPSYYFIAFVGLALGVVASELLRDIVHFLAKCLTPLLMGLLFVLIYVQIYQTETILGFNVKEIVGLDTAEILRLAQFNESYRDPFYSAISTLFAIIVALALVKGIEDVDEIRQNIAAETHHVRAVWNYLKYFEDDELTAESLAARGLLRTRILDYLTNVSNGNDRRMPQNNQQVLNVCRNAVLKIEPADRDDEIAHQEIIRSLEELGVLRSKRLGSNESSVSGYLMGALWVMSLALILPFLAEPLCIKAASVTAGDRVACGDEGLMLSPQRFSQYFMIFTIVSFFSFLMLMLHDLSSPDKGFFKVDLAAFDELNSELREEFDAFAHAPSPPPSLDYQPPVQTGAVRS